MQYADRMHSSYQHLWHGTQPHCRRVFHETYVSTVNRNRAKFLLGSVSGLAATVCVIIGAVLAGVRADAMAASAADQLALFNQYDSEYCSKATDVARKIQAVAALGAGA